MRNWWKIGLVIVVLLAVVGVLQLKNGKSAEGPALAAPGESAAVLPAPPPPAAAAPVPPPAAVLGPEPAPAASPARSQPAPVLGPEPAPAAAATPAAKPPVPAEKPPAPAAERPKVLPRMLELGSVNCIPCKMMVPVMDALRQEYGDKLKVEFVDIMQDQAVAEKYRIQSIPTQILFDREGQEVFRHLGFWPKEEIVAKFKELGLLD